MLLLPAAMLPWAGTSSFTSSSLTTPSASIYHRLPPSSEGIASFAAVSASISPQKSTLFQTLYSAILPDAPLLTGTTSQPSCDIGKDERSANAWALIRGTSGLQA